MNIPPQSSRSSRCACIAQGGQVSDPGRWGLHFFFFFFSNLKARSAVVKPGLNMWQTKKGRTASVVVPHIKFEVVVFFNPRCLHKTMPWSDCI